VIVDCITLLVSNIFSLYSDQALEQIEESVFEGPASAEIDELVECLKKLDASFIRGSGTVTFAVDKAVKDSQEYILDGETSESISGGSGGQFRRE